jgi:hypothetical protein
MDCYAADLTQISATVNPVLVVPAEPVPDSVAEFPGLAVIQLKTFYWTKI